MRRIRVFVSVLVLCVVSSSLMAQKPRNEEARKRKTDSTFASVREAEAKIEQVLFNRGDFAFAKTPLAGVVSYIATNYSINVTLDRRALEQVGIKPDALVTFAAKNVSLH